MAEKVWTDVPKVLTVAGSDSSGGAGVQADLKTLLAHGAYGMSVITALTAQNTTGVLAVQEAQFRAVFEDIRPDAVKVGMVSSPALIEVIADSLQHDEAQHIVVDPVMVATSGASLLAPEAVQVLTQRLLPLAEVITPNLPELAALTGLTVDGREAMVEAARQLQARLGVSVLAKGGHLAETADDLLLTADGPYWLPAERVDNPDTHGTGCTLSSAIAANLAKGLSLYEAVRQAKAYLTGALRAGLHLGHGSGPLNHAFAISKFHDEDRR